MTNSLLSRQQLHQSRLVEHFSVIDAWRLGKMGPPVPGSPLFGYLPQSLTGTSQPHGLRVLYGEVRRQATMLAFNDIYRLSLSR
jgi:hypothetical protein